MSLLRGTVVDNQDPLKRGRCRVYVWGVHKTVDGNLPWAETAGSTMFATHKGSGYSGVLQIGTTVWVQFEQNDIQCPVIVGVFVGHDTNTMAEISPDNSDFNSFAKDDYGKVWMFSTPEGLEFIMNDSDKSITISNGSAEITMKGNDIIVEGNMQVNGHITAQGMFAPNICYCNGPGQAGGPDGSDGSGRTEEEIRLDNKCSPKDCTFDFGIDRDPSNVHPYMAVLLEEAQKQYKSKHNKEFFICETTVSPDKMVCNHKAHSSEDQYPLEALCGLAIKVAPDEESCNQPNPTDSAKPEDQGGSETPKDTNNDYNIKCGTTIPQWVAFKDLISKHEGTPQSFNRGRAYDSPNERIDFTKLTFKQYFARNKGVPYKDKIFAWGSYQMIPSTTRAALRWAGLSESDYMTHQNREKLFNQLILKKRPDVASYLGSEDPNKDSLDNASLALAQEWASLGIPKNIGKKKKDQSYYPTGGNKAHTSSAEVKKALVNLREGIKQVSKAKGISMKEARDCVMQSLAPPGTKVTGIQWVDGTTDVDSRPVTEPKPAKLDNGIKEAFIKAQQKTQVANITFKNNWVVITGEKCEDAILDQFKSSSQECDSGDSGGSAGSAGSETTETTTE